MSLPRLRKTFLVYSPLATWALFTSYIADEMLVSSPLAITMTVNSEVSLVSGG